MSPDPDLHQAHWRQYRGDPAIRGGMFEQHRVRSAMDDQFDETFARIETLMTQHGVFHAKLHFSSSRATLWLYDDPHRYRVLSLDELLHTLPWHDYPPAAYPFDAIVASQQIRAVLEMFRVLRFSDEQIYLRAASLNLINGMVGLIFSCDGSYYLDAQEFLASPLTRWFGG
jgi:hypothetical protein